MQQVFKGWSHEFLKKIQCSKSYNVCHHLQDFNSENVEAFKKCLYLRKKTGDVLPAFLFIRTTSHHYAKAVLVTRCMGYRDDISAITSLLHWKHPRMQPLQPISSQIWPIKMIPQSSVCRELIFSGQPFRRD